jgi:hypothetical protein
MLDMLIAYIIAILFAALRVSIFFAGWILLLMALPEFLQYR